MGELLVDGIGWLIDIVSFSIVHRCYFGEQTPGCCVPVTHDLDGALLVVHRADADDRWN